MVVARLTLLAVLAIVDGKRAGFSEAYTQRNLAAAAREQEAEGNLQPTAISVKEAAKEGNVAALKAHKEAGVDLGAPLNSQGMTVAHYAAWFGHAAALRFLAEVGVNFEAKAWRGGKGTDWFVGWTPAHLAARYDHVEAMRALSKAGADLEAADKYGETPAHVAASYDRPAVLHFLKQAGADLEVADNEGNTPIHKAAYFGKAAAVRFLIQAGVNVKALNKLREPPVNVASDSTVMQMLLQASRARRAR
ncbi:Ankrd10 [Symbiodinium sp. CCMP2592]|nr:Ankrd10 [Symbiodinium sp. CCMP2592]